MNVTTVRFSSRELFDFFIFKDPNLRPLTCLHKSILFVGYKVSFMDGDTDVFRGFFFKGKRYKYLTKKNV